MRRVARFEKVSYEQFRKDILEVCPGMTEGLINDIYDSIKLPRRATAGSAGYDFFLPMNLYLTPGEAMVVPTGIRVDMAPGWVLKCYPRSGLGFKYRAQLDNTVGIIDQDYYHSDNEGHIKLKIRNLSNDENKVLFVDRGKAFAQGIFMEYGITYDDDVSSIRNGGFGSTGM